MNPVIQEDRTGGGFPSVAAIASRSYQEMKTMAGQSGMMSTTRNSGQIPSIFRNS
jgi:hypothetical protein